MKIKISALLVTILASSLLHSSNITGGLQQDLVGSNHDYEQGPLFVFVVPSYNNENYYQKNLYSMFYQTYPFFHVIYIDDCSPDDTAQLVENYIKDFELQDRITLIKNQKNVGALANIYKAVHMCDPRVVIVGLDGDDWLDNGNVLALLAEKYSNPDVWITWGQYRCYPSHYKGHCAPVPKHIIDTNNFRDYNYVTSALRTFYAGLFHKIKKEDLLYEGKFFPMAWDLSIMFPMLEMAGHHSTFIPNILYVYNIETPLNDFKVNNRQTQIYYDMMIRKQKKYQRISSPF